MRTDVSLNTRIIEQCKLAGFETDYLYKHGKKVLKIVHDACRNTALDADDLVEELCSDSYETDEFAVILNNNINIVHINHYRNNLLVLLVV